MNKVILMGRLVRDPDIRCGQGQQPMAIARYTLAVDRRFKKDGEQSADFINCVAFGKNGEFAEKYLKKGTKIVVTGHIQTGSYIHKESGQKIYTTDVIVEEHEFCESKVTSQKNNSDSVLSYSSAEIEGFMNIPDGIDEELPFN